MPQDDDVPTVAALEDRLRERDLVIAGLRAELRQAREVGIAIGVLLARSPGWTELEATEAWERACDELTRDGHVEALASYVVQTGALPGHGVEAPG
ncbi:hypothetical protein [Jatrophihabitans fulvus]